MPVEKVLNPDFEITAKVTYVAEESKPDQSYYFFTYKISVKNKSQFSAQLLSRHWIITDGFGQIEEVRGPGVVGLQPKIPAGKSFEYESACPLQTTSGSMRGTYQMIADNGESFEIEIPEFYLVAPTAIH